MKGSLPTRLAARLGSPSVLFGAVCAATLLAYARSFTVPFQFDDFDQILGNPAIQSPTAQSLLYWGRARLIPFLTLALNWRLGGEDTTGYHVVNLAIHLGATFLVFRLALALCDTPRMRGTPLAECRLALATATAFVFACHPIQIQAVTYIVQRVSSLCAMFYVGSVLAYVTARNRRAGENHRARGWYVAAVLLAAGALLSKENAASLPLAIVLVEWVFQPRGSLRRSLRLWLPFALLALAVPLMWVLFWRVPSRVTALTGPNATWLDQLLRIMSPSGPVSPLDYFLTQCTVVPRYLALVVLPWGFNVDHDIAIARSLSPLVVGGLAFLTVLLAFGVYAKRRWPLVGFGILWFFVTLAVESSVLPIGDPMMEHRMYLPMVGVSLVLGSAFATGYRARPALSVACGVAVGLALVVLTIARNEVWGTQLGLWTDALSKSPGKARVHANVGSYLQRSGKLDDAVAEFCKTLQIDPSHPSARRNLEITLQQQLDDEDDESASVEVIMDENGVAIPDLDARCRRVAPPGDAAGGAARP